MRILIDLRAPTLGEDRGPLAETRRPGAQGIQYAACRAGAARGRSPLPARVLPSGLRLCPPSPRRPHPPLPPTLQAAVCRGVGGCRGAGGCPHGPCGGSRARGCRAVAPRGRGGRPRARPSHRRTLAVPPGESGPVPAPPAPASARRRGGPAAWRGMPTRRAARTRQTGGAVRSGARRRRPTAGRGRPAPPQWRAIRASLRRGRPAPRAHPRPASKPGH